MPRRTTPYARYRLEFITRGAVSSQVHKRLVNPGDARAEEERCTMARGFPTLLLVLCAACQSEPLAVGTTGTTVDAGTDGTTVVDSGDGGTGDASVVGPCAVWRLTPAADPPGGLLVGPESTSLGDLNGDGKLDLAVGTLYGVDVLLGKGDGTFAPAVGYGVATGGNSVAIGDLNGDGKLDLVMAGNGISVLLGNGDGTFGAPVAYDPSHGTSSDASGEIDDGSPAVSAYFAVIGDMNGDGKPDIVAADGTNGTLSVLLGNGDGSFQAPLVSLVGASAWAVALGDFNADGKLDAAVADMSAGAVDIVLGEGNGSFQPPTVYSTGGDAVSVAVGDVNGDGKLDFAVTWTQGGDEGYETFSGNGDGTFVESGFQNLAAVPVWIALGDMNGNGSLDFVTVIRQQNFVDVILQSGNVNNANGPLGFGTTQPTGSSPTSVSIGDLNGDGILDLAVSNYTSQSVTVLLGEDVLPSYVCGAGETCNATLRVCPGVVDRTDCACTSNDTWACQPTSPSADACAPLDGSSD